MKVICIDADAFPPNLEWEDDGGLLKEGEVYEVVDVFMEEGYIFYELNISEDGYGYWENCFARLSDEHETEQYSNKKEEVVTN